MVSLRMGLTPLAGEPMRKIEIEVDDATARRLTSYCNAHSKTPSHVFKEGFAAYARDRSLGDIPDRQSIVHSGQGNVYNIDRSSSFKIGDVLSNISILNGIRLVFPNGGSIDDWARLVLLWLLGATSAVVWFSTM